MQQTSDTATVSCDPLNLEGRPGHPSFRVFRRAVGANERQLVVLETVSASGLPSGAFRVFFGQETLRERVVLATDGDNRSSDFSIRFRVEGGEAQARFGSIYTEQDCVTFDAPSPYVPHRDPVTLELPANGEVTRLRLDEKAAEASRLVGADFLCLSGSPDVEWEASSSCGEATSIDFCIEDGSEELDVAGTVRVDATFSVTGRGLGQPPESECPFHSKQLIGGLSSSDAVSFANSAWVQGVDELGRTVTLSVSFPSARLSFAADEVLTLDGRFEPFAATPSGFELRREDGTLLLWYAQGYELDELNSPPEIDLVVGEVACSGVACVSWALHSLDVTQGSDTATAAPNAGTRVGNGWFLHNGVFEDTGEGDGENCPSHGPGGPVSVFYYDSSLQVRDTGGVGGPCLCPDAEPTVEVGDTACIGGLSNKDGYLSVACASDEDCPGASRCDGTFCRAPCKRDADCTDGMECSATSTHASEPFSYCRCGADCFEERCDVESCPEDCPAGERVSYFQSDAVLCLDDDSECEPGFQRFDLAGCGCGCEPIPEASCPPVPDDATFEYAPGGCNADCAPDELRVETSCGCGCTKNPSCPRYYPFDEDGPDYVGEPGECEGLCDEGSVHHDDDCGCFCYPTLDLPILCDVPADPGPCSGSESRFYRNPYTGVCERFSFGGCLGNWNNFLTKEACEAQCGP